MTTLTITSSRFGQVSIDPGTIIEFPHGLIGLGGRRYALLQTREDSVFMWLQSLDDEELALPVINPHDVFSNFEVEIADADAAELQLSEDTDARVYVTVRATEDFTQSTANLKAPILVVDRQGFQVINQAAGCDLRAPLFAAE